MALEFTLTKPLLPGLWEAKGFFEDSKGTKGELDILVKKEF